MAHLSLTYILVVIVCILISLVIHEFMHAYVGYKLGDDTASEDGRLTLNPLKHIDPMMTLALPVITVVLFGAPILAAKPVPFDPDRVRFEEFGAALLAVAGPLSNLVLAVVGSVALKALTTGTFWAESLTIFVALNVALFIFNILPIPPLDGSRVLYAFAPEPLQDLMRQLEPYGLFIIFGLVIAGGFSFLTNLNQMVLNLLP